MNLTDAIRSRRSIRLFQNKPVPEEILRELADIARLYPSAGNMQPIRTAIVTKPPMLNRTFENLGWAMYLPDFQIGEDERPPAYIILLADRKGCQFDAGAAAMAIMLAAQEFELSTCCLGIGKQDVFCDMLNCRTLVPLVAIAVGYPAHCSQPVPHKGTAAYSVDETRCFYVPKLSLKDTLVFSDFIISYD